MWAGVTGVVIAILAPLSAEAQQRPGAWEVKAVVGLVGFLDERTDYRFVIGGAIRTYVSSQVAIESEFLYMRENEFRQDYLLQANLVRDFAGNTTSRPYLIGGVGILHHRGNAPGAREPSFSSNSLTGSGGVGVRIQTGQWLFVSPEFRIGSEPLFRGTVSLGW